MAVFRLPIRRLSFVSLLVGAIFGCCLNSFVLQSLQELFLEDITPEVVLRNETLTETFIEFNENSSVEKREVKDEGVTKDSVDLNEKVRVLCWIMTSPENHETKSLAVKETWGKRCNVILFLSSEKDSKLPTVQLQVKEGRDHLWGKTREAFRYAWDLYKDEVDWFLKADDDTYVIVENLRYFLSAFNSSEPMWFDHKYKTNVTAGFHSGGAGYVLSKEATRRFVQEGPSICKNGHEGAEDVEMGRCMEGLKVLTMDTRDSMGRGRFFPFQPDRFYFSRKITNYWYWKFVYYSPLMGADCCSDTTISFHYIDPKMMHLLDFFLYKIRPYGIVDHRPATPEPPPDLELTVTPWFAPNETTNVGGIPAMITQKRNAEDSGVNAQEIFIEKQEATDHQQSPPDYNRYQVLSAEMIDQQTSTLKPLPVLNQTTNFRFIRRKIESEINNVPVNLNLHSQLKLKGNDTISNAHKRSKVPFERKTFNRNVTKMNAPATETVAEKVITSKRTIVIPNVLVANQKDSVDIPINNKRKAYRKKEVIDFQKLYLKEKGKLTDL